MADELFFFFGGGGVRVQTSGSGCKVLGFIGLVSNLSPSTA